MTQSRQQISLNGPSHHRDRKGADIATGDNAQVFYKHPPQAPSPAYVCNRRRQDARDTFGSTSFHLLPEEVPCSMRMRTLAQYATSHSLAMELRQYPSTMSLRTSYGRTSRLDTSCIEPCHVHCLAIAGREHLASFPYRGVLATSVRLSAKVSKRHKEEHSARTSRFNCAIEGCRRQTRQPRLVAVTCQHLPTRGNAPPSGGWSMANA